MHYPTVIETDTIISEGFSYEIRQRSFPVFEIITVGEMMELAETMGENPIIQMRQQLGQLIQVGFEFLELEWYNKGDTFNSLCIVSNENGGVVYEPVAGNITTGSGKTVVR